MKSTRTRSHRTAAFVGAMLIAFAGVTGTFATSGLNDTLVASADWYDDSYEGSAYAENLANAYREFFNLKNENDKITVYTMRVGTDGTFKNGTQEARFTLTGSQNVGGIDVDALLESENFDPSNEILIAVRSINGGSYDYFSFENVYTCVYLGRNPFIFDEWEKNGKPDMIDGTLKFDTAIDKTGFKLGLDSIGSIAKMGMGAVLLRQLVRQLPEFLLLVQRQLKAVKALKLGCRKFKRH